MLTIMSIDRNPGVLTYTNGGRVMATRWFNVRDGWMFLTSVKIDSVHRVAWQHENDVWLVLGDDSDGVLPTPPEVHGVAMTTALPFARTATSQGLEFASRAAANRAVEAANQALQAAFPMEAPPWATLALVHGWTPPEAP